MRVTNESIKNLVCVVHSGKNDFNTPLKPTGKVQSYKISLNFTELTNSEEEKENPP